MTGSRWLGPVAICLNLEASYEKAVKQWHRLAGRGPPKRYGRDHRGRGGWTDYVRMQQLDVAAIGSCSKDQLERRSPEPVSGTSEDEESSDG